MKTILLTITLATAFSIAPLMAEEGMQCCCKKMAEGKAAMNDKMDVKMKAADAQVAALLDQMNASAGDRKIEAMAALINTMLQERKAMHAAMAAAHPKAAPGAAPADAHAAHSAAAAPADPHAAHSAVAAPGEKKSCCEPPSLKKAIQSADPAKPAVQPEPGAKAEPSVKADPAAPVADAPKAPAHQH